MLTLTIGDTIAGTAGTATAITYTITGTEVWEGVPTYKVLTQGQLPLVAATLYTTPNTPSTTLVKTIHLANTTALDVPFVQMFVNGTAAINRITGNFTIPAAGWATMDQDGWRVYNSSGALLVTGTTGPTGPAGPAGPAVYLAAEQGEDGQDGAPGPQGLQGVTGNQGPLGPAVFLVGDTEDGDQGPPGVQGATGDTGAVGPAVFLAADQGEDGDVGPPGIQGLTGPQGIQGPLGPSGIQGDQGDDGDTGPIGPRGLTGDTGAVGPAVFLIADEGEEGQMGPPGPAAAAASATVAIKAAVLNLGADAKVEHNITVVDATVASINLILVMWGATLDTDDNGPDTDSVTFRALAGTGSFVVRLGALNPISKLLKINYLVG